MTDVKNSRLYKTLKKAVRKKDHAELLRMLEMANPKKSAMFDGLDATRLTQAFFWSATPQLWDYWFTLSMRLEEAGHDCY
jgi:hypothetical protein